ncbi:hypothetical protein SLS56_009972 [Neofusicoccum ribis]|uniref:aldehyde dehydrogenase (NAD(+)) n=1 Tax=Neofusicoccum ribis TaxID=45134 RepID=A0ABR3SFU6_9PEZI
MQVVFKSSEKAPLGLAAMGTLIKAAGFPPGVVQILSGPGSTGALLAEHPNIAKISFTGSVATGKKIHAAAARSNLKRVTLELGGKSPAIVFEDADLENAVRHCTAGLLVNSGQACFASSRILVQRSVASRFLAALQTAFSSIAAAMRDPALLRSPLEELGPLADREQFDRVMSFIENAERAHEATLLVGGRRVGEKGYYVEPTLFVDPKPDADIYRREIFGPVGVVRTFETEQEAICEANDSFYGLSSKSLQLVVLPRSGNG